MPRQIVTGFSCSNAIILQLVQEISRLAEESIQEKEAEGFMHNPRAKIGEILQDKYSTACNGQQQISYGKRL